MFYERWDFLIWGWSRQANSRVGPYTISDRQRSKGMILFYVALILFILNLILQVALHHPQKMYGCMENTVLHQQQLSLEISLSAIETNLTFDFFVLLNCCSNISDIIYCVSKDFVTSLFYKFFFSYQNKQAVFVHQPRARVACFLLAQQKTASFRVLCLSTFLSLFRYILFQPLL